MADITVTKADVRPLPGYQSEKYPAAGALSLGDFVYLKSDGTVELADADALATLVSIGIVISCPQGRDAAVAGETVDVQFSGRVTGFSGMTIGALVFLSTTAGKLQDARPAGSSGDFVWVAGIAVSATTIRLLGFTDSFAAA